MSAIDVFVKLIQTWRNNPISTLGKRSTLDRCKSASPRCRGSPFPHDENNHRMERTMNGEQDNRSTLPLNRTRDNGLLEQRDSSRRAKRPEDFEFRARHTLAPERIQSEFRRHRNGPNAAEDEAPDRRLDTSLKIFYQETFSFPRPPQKNG